MIGETQNRVDAYAQQHGYSVYRPSTDFGGDKQQQLELNASVIRGAIDRNMTIKDIGPDEDRLMDVALPWFSALEQALIAQRGYPRQEVTDAPAEDCSA